MFSINTLRIVAIVTITGTIGLGQNLSINYSNLTAYLKLTTSLKLKDSCSWTHEVDRINWTKRISGVRVKSKEFTQEVHALIDDVVTNNKTFCSGAELVVCDEQTEMCKCGDPGKRATLPNSIDAFVEEVDENGDLRCRWDEGSYCASDDIFREIGLSFVNSKCRRGTRCASKSDGSDCSFATLLHFTSTHYPDTKSALSIEDVSKDMFSGKICTCETEDSKNEIVPEVSDRRRRKLRSQTYWDIVSIPSAGVALGLAQLLAGY